MASSECKSADLDHRVEKIQEQEEGCGPSRVQGLILSIPLSHCMVSEFQGHQMGHCILCPWSVSLSRGFDNVGCRKPDGETS